jgi:uncharacterized protein Yka (UPF0111/DUF47 family)
VQDLSLRARLYRRSIMKRTEKKDLSAMAEKLDELACTAEAAAMLAEMAETDATLRRKMPSILRAMFKQLAQSLRAAATELDELK